MENRYHYVQGPIKAASTMSEVDQVLPLSKPLIGGRLGFEAAVTMPHAAGYT